MTSVRIADLKAHLSQHLRKVRRGRSLLVLDRETPIARIVPIETESPLEVRRATRSPKDILPAAPPAGATDSLAVLLEDRASR
jgi:prevent-host-death family protein